jgi:hypothetical protein
MRVAWKKEKKRADTSPEEASGREENKNSEENPEED